MDPANDPASPVQKSGFKTSEFVGMIIALIVAVLPAILNALPGDSAWAVPLGALLSAATYAAGRSLVKASGNKAAAFVEAAKANPPQSSGPA